MKRALITGITGQDGRYLSQLLSEQGYQVFGLIRGQANPKAQLVLDENPGVELVDGDLRDLSSLIAVMEQVQPDEVYNLAAMSFVQLSFKQAELTSEITGLGVLRMLEAVRIVGGVENNPIRFYQASSSEMFGKVRETPQSEKTPFHPRSPYGVAKVFGHDMTVNYREAYDLHASSGILFNHESERRGMEFVTRKITNSLARIKLGLQDRISLGNLDSARDWGFAGDYVKAMWMMLQQPDPDDYVIATGETHTIREFLDTAFHIAGYDSWEPFVTHDTRFDRPADVDLLMGDATKAKEKLGWTPSVTFDELVRRMYEADLKSEQAQLAVSAAATRAATRTGSHTGENGGAYPRSSEITSSAVISFQMHVARTSMRLAAPSRPTIWAPSTRPVTISVTSFTRTGVESG
jgi:GDPmannose 4,6-dehydratase